MYEARRVLGDYEKERGAVALSDGRNICATVAPTEMPSLVGKRDRSHRQY